MTNKWISRFWAATINVQFFKLAHFAIECINSTEPSTSCDHSRSYNRASRDTYIKASNKSTPATDTRSASAILPRIVVASSMVTRFLLVLFTLVHCALGASYSNKRSLPGLSATANIPATEMNALRDLYNATNGQDWHWHATAIAGIRWNFTATALNNPCVDRWQGVKCSFSRPFEYYHVTDITLPAYNLVGTLPTTLEYLSELQNLILNSNLLTGTIPDSLGHLSQLRNLYLDTNYLKSSIPESLGDLALLEQLLLYTNQLSYSMPASLGNLRQLLALEVSFNQLKGSIPESFGSLTQLQYLNLYDNQLTGTIPESLGNLLNLQHLNLYYNQLTGSLPSTLGNLVLLIYVQLHYNQLNGSIPDSFGNLTDLIYLDIYNNELTGSIPESLGNMTKLQYLILFLNQINGTLPDSLGNLTQLIYLDIDTNLLTGTIPESLGNLSLIEYINFDFNQLSSTIPEVLGTLSLLEYLYLSTNQLSGSIPASLGNLQNLQKLNLDYNWLTGTIPSSLGNLQQLQFLVLNNNVLRRNIPASLGNMRQLQVIILSSNQLTGSIPDSLGNLVQLQYIELDTNQLVSTIPESFGNLTQVQEMLLMDNYLSGTIPPSLGRISLLHGLYLFTNQLSGTIPVSIGNLSLLLYLELDSNRLTGTIPYIASSILQQLQLSNNRLVGIVPSLTHISDLQVVLLHNNHLTGTLDHIFSLTEQMQLKTVVLANNQFTGTIPEALFQLNLQTFVGTSNCFEGPLPISAICSNLNMVSFVIDGMSSASSCRNKLFAGHLSAYTLDYKIDGGIPICLFLLPNLTTLHLSGIGFTGSIPSDITYSDSLTDLSLSHNALTGTISDHMQQKQWTNIDLSYNRISGTLLSSFASNRSIELDNNRISGVIPAQFRSMANLTMLGSNTFSCRYDESDLPEHDPNRGQYHCGSNTFDVLFYIWLGTAVCTLIWVCYNMKTNQSLLSVLRKDALLLDTNLYITLTVICRMALTCALYSIIILLPLYTICSATYGTQTYEYAYQVSAVYMSGVVPFALDWCFWWILLLSIKVMLSCAPSIVSRNTGVSEQTSLSVWETLAVFVPYLFIDIIVVAGVNAAYVYVAVYRSSSLLLVVQTLLSIFKVVWGRLGLPYLLAVLSQRKTHGKVQVFTQIVVSLLNNIMVPCLIVAVVSPNCFYNALVAAPAVTSVTSYTQCSAVDTDTGQCVQSENVLLPTSFVPPFTYNYQCSSSLVTYYAPAFVSMCIVCTFVTPLAQYSCQWLHKRATVGTPWWKLLDTCLPRLLKPISDSAANTDRGYLNIGGLITALIGTFGLILTFGVMFPPLCVAFAVNICATVIFFRNNVSSCSTQQASFVLQEIVRAECNSVDAMHILKGSVWLLITVSCWFYTLFLFDTLGDAAGFERAYWVLIVMPLMPLVLYVLYTNVRRFGAYQVSQVDKDVNECAKEMENAHSF